MIDTAQIDDRIAKCQKILEVDPNSQIFAALAEAYRKRGDLDKAFQVCQNGLRIHPSYGSAHLVMSKINLDRGLYDWAEIEVKKAQDLDGPSRATDLLLAEIFIFRGDFERAVKLLKRLHRNDPNDEQISRLLDIAQKIPEEQAREMGETVAAVPQYSPVSGGKPSVVHRVLTGSETVVERPKAATTMTGSEILKRSIAYPGIGGALFINNEGLVVDKEWTLRMDPMACGATIGEIGSELNRDMVEASFGHIGSILIETDEPTFYLVRVDDGAFVFVCEPGVNLGGLRMKIDNLLDKYRPED